MIAKYWGKEKRAAQFAKPFGYQPYHVLFATEAPLEQHMEEQQNPDGHYPCTNALTVAQLPKVV